MTFRYDSPPISSPLRQGEVIQSLREVIPITSGLQKLSDETKTIPVYQSFYPFAMVVSQDCDLDQDCKARNRTEPDRSKLLAHIQFCELFPENEIRIPRKLGHKDWTRVNENQYERYHHLNGASIVDNQNGDLPDLYADFKRTFSLDVGYAYWLISSATSARIALLLDPYLRDFIHRLHSFLSRVPLPDQGDSEPPPQATL